MRGITLLFVASLTLAALMSTSASGNSDDLLNSYPGYQSGFPVTLDGPQVRGSSIALGDVDGDGIDDIVVGTIDGKVRAFRRDGTKILEHDTGDMAIENKAAIGDVDKDGWNEIVVGAGSTFTPGTHGGLYVIDRRGRRRCSVMTGDFDGDGWREGVYSSPSLADLDENDGGRLEIAFGGWDGYVRVVNDDCSPVWVKSVRDSIWSSPAIGDIDKDGHPEIVIGVDSHIEAPFGTLDGGILHVYNADGGEVPGFPIQIDEVIYSSPALGDINGDGWLEIVVGTGRCYDNPACAPLGRVHPGVGKYLNAWDHSGNYLPNWPKMLNDTYAYASPALADIDEDGLPEVIVNTADGWVHALNGDASYVPGWPVLPTTPGGVHFPTPASPVVADIDGDGGFEVLLPSNWDLVAWNKNGKQLTRTEFGNPPPGVWSFATEYTVNSSPAVGDIDGDGDVEVVVGGAANNSGSPGALYAWDLAGRAATEASWPTFRWGRRNRACSFVAPTLSVSPGSLFIMHESGDRSNPITSIQIRNEGSGDISWWAQPGHGLVSVSPENGSASSSATEVEVEIYAGDLPRGLYNLGDITVSGTVANEPVNGSPSKVPVSLYVGNVSRIFFPAVIK
jgi:hypothetical protein